MKLRIIYEMSSSAVVSAAPAAPPKESPTKPNTPSRPKPAPWNPTVPSTHPLPRPKAMAAPAAPPKEAPTRPTTPAKPKPSPWNPPLPNTHPLPKPKAKTKSIRETFERSVHHRTASFWSDLPQNKEHIFGKHPLYTMHGLDKAKRAWLSGVESLKKLYPALANMPNPQIMQQVPMLAQRAIQDVMRIEAPHKRQLEQLAIDLVHEVWGIPKNLLKARIVNQPGMDQDDDNDDSDEYDSGLEEREQSIDHLRDQINKRLTMNTMTQGAAVHNMYTIHHMAKERLEQIAPELIDLYSKFATGSHSFYWLIDFNNIGNLASHAIGNVKLNRDEEDGQLQVEAQAMVFPVLVQELVKGAMEILTLHGMKDLPEEDYRTVLKHADKLEYEPWQIQIGTDLWKSFLKIVPKDFPLSEVIPALSQQDPKFIHNLLSNTLEAIKRNEDPAESREILRNMLEELREASQGEYSDEDYGSEE